MKTPISVLSSLLLGAVAATTLFPAAASEGDVRYLCTYSENDRRTGEQWWEVMYFTTGPGTTGRQQAILMATQELLNRGAPLNRIPYCRTAP